MGLDLFEGGSGGVWVIARTDDAGEDEGREAEVAGVWPVAACDVAASRVGEGEDEDHGGGGGERTEEGALSVAPLAKHIRRLHEAFEALHTCQNTMPSATSRGPPLRVAL